MISGPHVDKIMMDINDNINERVCSKTGRELGRKIREAFVDKILTPTGNYDTSKELLTGSAILCPGTAKMLKDVRAVY
jgi:hypothetical protein